MNNTMIIDNHKALITFDADLQMFRGEFIGLNGGADFYSDTVEGLQREAHLSLQAFLRTCKENGIKPYQQYSGRILTRLPSELHEQVAHTAIAQGISINQFVKNTLAQAVQA
ncbi:DNA repair protein [Moraxella caviae]|uniref:DNA repair protein n=1 Tax=Moraxella caviae TaxID=34060 RepID=A0A1T0A6E2_9GAMM|nr:type II toxin-antitoxin system HicB family antitoxin [Moraxella caviae]OOR91343.1 DNA repair protein [Moraxella caviae]STZ13953.1 Uncharacterized protein encoded in hypervariable junctions of pilus gene clusters [Moraxella caviae]VEW13006.1 Uncharacterized protein encoded in hypervariable junctions of pilus gene clusters [Moraxella caviae]